MNHPPTISTATPWISAASAARRIPVPMLLSGGTYFIHFLALGFASFPLQTHLRQLLGPSSASLVASVTPIAACMTYFLFRFAESRSWTRSPQRLLAIVAALVALLQWTLGWRLYGIQAESWFLGPVLDAGICLLLLGCAHSSCMTLLNHIGVATMGQYAFTVRAAGSAGYMLAVILMGMFWDNRDNVSANHLFIACAISMLHVLVATAGFWYLRRRGWDQPRVGHSPRASVGTVGSASKERRELDKGSSTAAANHSIVAWWGLLALVWLVSMCEMSYGLYSHEFLTSLYGNLGYFLFAGAIAIEIALLLGMPWLPALRQRLLFVGPLGWVSLLIGCSLAIAGFLPMGWMAMALALNCPFQVSANEHAHRMTPSILGVASMTLAQSLGYMTATVVSAIVSDGETGPRNLWLTMIPVAIVALGLSLWKMAITPPEIRPEG